MKDTFSYWMRKNLKDAFSGLITQDIDFVFLIPKEKLFFFIEEKNSRHARVGPAQLILFKMFDDLFKSEINGYKFLGTLILTILEEKKLEDLLSEIEKGLKNRNYYKIENYILDRLWDCKGEPRIKKTEQERSGYRGSIIKKIIEKYSIHQNIYIEKIDWIFLNYCSGNFIFVEELTNCENNIPEGKKDFIKIIDEIFTNASEINTSKKIARNPKSNAVYKYLGYYKLVFSNTNPDNSEKIFLNSKEIDKNKLINMLNLDNSDIEKLRNNL